MTDVIEVLRKTLEEHGRRLERLEKVDVPAPSLAQIVATYQGGVMALAKETGFNRASIDSMKNRQRFSAGIAVAIAKAFGRRHSLGERVTVERLREAWARGRNQTNG